MTIARDANTTSVVFFAGRKRMGRAAGENQLCFRTPSGIEQEGLLARDEAPTGEHHVPQRAPLKEGWISKH
jgi:hypothetical protein